MWKMCYSLFFSLLFLLLNSFKFNHGAKVFGYSDPADWYLEYPSCAGSRQSPIDINTYATVPVIPAKPLQLNFHEVTPVTMTLKNNGHTVKLSGEWAAGLQPTIEGGPLNGVYVFNEVHFHWGSNDYVGSEHTILGQYVYPLEMHVLYWKQSYQSSKEAKKHSDGVAVIGYIFMLTYDDSFTNDGFRWLQPLLPYVTSPGTEIGLVPFALTLFGRNAAYEGYVSYQGSLTTPPCSEVVTWILGYHITYVSTNQLQAFRRLTLNNNDDHNYRPTQPLNGRYVNLYYGTSSYNAHAGYGYVVVG